MTSDDYMFLYSKLSSDKIPLHIKEKIDSGDEFTEVEKQEILKIIRKDGKFKPKDKQSILKSMDFIINCRTENP